MDPLPALPPIARRLASNFSWAVTSELVGRAGAFIAHVYLAKVLGVATFGLLVFAQTLTTFFWLAVDLGTNMYGMREVAKAKEGRASLVNSLLTVRVVAGLPVFLVYLAAVNAFVDTSADRSTFLACGLYLVTYSLNTEWVFRGVERFQFVAYGTMTSSLTFLLGVVLLVHDPQDAPWAGLVWSLSRLAAAAYLIAALGHRLKLRLRPCFDVKLWWRHLKESVYFTMTGALDTLNKTLPIFLIGVLGTKQEVGLFSAAQRTILTLSILATLLPMSFYPSLSESYGRANETFHRLQKTLFTIMLAIGSFTTAIAIIFGREIVLFLFGEDYLGSVIILKILAGTILLAFLRASFGYPILAMGLLRQRTLASGASLVACAIASLLLIPVLGGPGAAIALLLSEAVTMLAVQHIYRSHKKEVRVET